MTRRVLAVAATLLLAAGCMLPNAAAALTGSQFRAGYIISDAIFYNASAMSAADIQAFLVAREPTCANSVPACMRNYSMPTPQVPADTTAGLCQGYAQSASDSAATIIANVAASCGINPQSLLALIQRESGLVTASAPTQAQYNSATGAGCPDTSPCDPTRAGFFNQVYGAARQFTLYRQSPNSYNFVAGRTSQIQYNPNPACGSSAVPIQNQATAGLYNYTPYQPNAAALANLFGTGDSCSTYGNRNFWVLFNQWFGSTGTATYPLAPGSSPSGVAVRGGYEFAFVSPSGHLMLSGPAGTGDLGLGVAAGTSPSIVAVTGGVQIAFQASGGHLWTVGALGNRATGIAMAPGTSPSITAVPSGYEIAFQGADTALNLLGTQVNTRLPLGMAARTSPSIAAVPGGFEVAFQANTTAMWFVGTVGNFNTGLGMAAQTSPSITGVTGGVQVAFQANTGALWVVGALGNQNTARPMAPRTSPAIAAVSGGYEVAFVGADGSLWQTGALGTANPRLTVAPGTSPAIAPFAGGARISLHAGDDMLWFYGTGGTGQVLSTT